MFVGKSILFGAILVALFLAVGLVVLRKAPSLAPLSNNENQAVLNQNENTTTASLLNINTNIVVAVNDSSNENSNADIIFEETKPPPALVFPLDNALSRVTKKPFGIKVSPSNSPVSPERFSGYHTSVDFETFPKEQDIDVTVHAVCSGTLLVKEYATGYGGVAVQSCTLENEAVTIVYGHVKLASITKSVGDQILAGENLGILGKGYSAETDGEPKHLHLGIHKGTGVNIKGYVQTSAELASWLDPTRYMQ